MENKLNTAKGIVNALVIGGLFWLVVFVVWYLW